MCSTFTLPSKTYKCLLFNNGILGAYLDVMSLNRALVRCQPLISSHSKGGGGFSHDQQSTSFR
jgi:hypothetical protein